MRQWVWAAIDMLPEHHLVAAVLHNFEDRPVAVATPVEYGTYVALSGPHLAKEALIEIAESMSPTAGLRP